MRTESVRGAHCVRAVSTGRFSSGNDKPMTGTYSHTASATKASYEGGAAGVRSEAEGTDGDTGE